MNKYPLTKQCSICGSDYIVRNGAEFRKVACSTICGNKKAAKTRSGKNHWNWKNSNAPRGRKHPMYGKHHTKEAKEKNRLKHLGKTPWNKDKKDIYSKISIDKMRKANKGKHLSLKTEFQKGSVPWNKNKKCPQLSGKNNSNWIKDRTKLKTDRQKAYDTKYKYWMLSVKKRDNWKCKMSNGECKGRLVSHHIFDWENYPTLRYIINNGITLCHFHHPVGREKEKQFIPIFQELIRKNG